MLRILFIEPSATLRHALGKQLRHSDYDVTIETDYETGLNHLLSQQTLRPFDAIILDWPNQTLTSTDELLANLSEPPFDELALVVLSHEPDPAKLEWVSGREHTAFLLWDNHHDITQSLQKLLNRESPQTQALNREAEDPIRILLVDDSPTARVKFRKLLANAGYLTDTASGAKEAREKAHQNRYDIAIIDYFMPDVTGDALCRQLLDDTYTAPIMPAILTSTYLDKVITDSLAAGAVDCMFKNEATDLFLARVAAMSRTVRMTRRIEQERLRLSGILSSVGDGVYGMSREGLITFVNPAVCQILGYDGDQQLVGRKPADLFHSKNAMMLIPGKQALPMQKAVEQGQKLYAVESVFTRTDGTPIQVELTIFPLCIDGHEEGAVIAFRDISVRKLLEEELKWQANHDPLTKLLNRMYLEDVLEQEVQRLQRSEEQSALLYIDLDRFKYINDTIGHAAGDQLLIEVGQQLNQRLRKADILARIGGDEFAIILHNINSKDLFNAADGFRQLLEDYSFTREGRTYKINGSLGVSVISKNTRTPGEVLSNADIACHVAKGKGRNRTHIYNPTEDDKVSMDMELGWSTRLRQALDNDSFALYYQPIIPIAQIDMDTLPDDQGALWSQLLQHEANNTDTFYEALLRMHDSQGKPVSPNAFLPTAERFNMMPDIDKWVVKNALAQLSQYQIQHPATTITINLSGQSLESQELVNTIHQAISAHSLNPENILFEITETCAIARIDKARNFINQLSEFGCRFALDDFGSGYCSFAHLKNLPVDFIKIDGLFVKDIVNDPMDRAIVTSITHIAHSLGKKTIAEFVENTATLRLLKDCGVDYVQGFYITPPISRLPLTEEPDLSVNSGLYES